MEASHALLVILSLLSCLTEVLSSNPDSVNVQDSADDSDESDPKKPAPLLSSESQQRSSADTQRYRPSLPNITVQPFISDGRKLWRNVASYRYMNWSIDRLRGSRPFGTYFSQRREYRRKRPDFMFPADKVTTTAKEEAVTDESQSAWTSSPKVTGFNSRPDGSSNDREADSFPPSGSRNPGDSKNSAELPEDISYGSPSDDEIPTEKQLPSDFDGDTRGQNGKGIIIYPPASFNPSSSSGESGRRTSYDRPFSSSTGERAPSGFRPDTSEQGGRGTSEDRPLLFEPSSPDNSSSEEFGPDASEDSENEPSSGESEESWNFPTTRSPPALEECSAKRRLSRDSSLLSAVINDFAFKLVDFLKLETNFVVSPLSIFEALSMCYLASDGTTQSELENVLGLNANTLRGLHLHKGMKDLLSLVLQSSGGNDLETANGMFLGQNFTINEEFVRDMQQFYAADLKNLDFDKPELSMPILNEWVSRATKNMITSLTDSHPPALTRLLLVSAVYFKGIWKTQFPPNMTFSGWFMTSNGDTTSVPTMPLFKETFPYFKSDELRHSFLKLPYEGDEVSMIIALPYTSREKPMPTVTDAILCSVRDAMANTVLDTVTLPKFRLESTRSLRPPLERLGMRSLFNPITKDLSKMRKENDVHVSAILHKAAIEVNERGTTASATTTVHIVPLTLRSTRDFEVNHPFAFYIVHEPSGLVMFYGKIYHLGRRSDVFPNNRRQAAKTTPPPTVRRDPSGAPKDSRRQMQGTVTYENKK